ncbi:MAG: hypothetical protein OEM61_14415, partial [Desulfobacteraceae bacterium]|nr:hypothetical protein [Desulfobacteraceae bacterium]
FWIYSRYLSPTVHFNCHKTLWFRTAWKVKLISGIAEFPEQSILLIWIIILECPYLQAHLWYCLLEDTVQG